MQLIRVLVRDIVIDLLSFIYTYIYNKISKYQTIYISETRTDISAL